MESGNEDNVFELNVQRQFSILKLLKNAIDIKKSEYDLVFVASDGQLPQRQTNATLKVYNEAKLTSSPVVVERELSVSIPEDSPVGTFVAQVHTNSSECEFTLNSDAPFEVDRNSGKSALRSESGIKIPRCDRDRLLVLKAVNMMGGRWRNFGGVFDVTADRGDNARLLYRLRSGIATEFLSIDSTSGKVTLRKAVDFEAVQGFDVEIEVCDHGHPELCTATILPTVIQDVNDNVPVFPCSVVHAVLPVNSSPGTVVSTVYAEDRDTAVAGQVHYAILDAITGSLYLAKPVPTNSDQFYAVLIAHSDEVSITKCVELRVIRDPPAPKFSKKSTTLKLKRNTPLGNQLMKVDAGAGGHFNFSSNCRWLRIDNDGVILPLLLNATYNVHMKEDARPGTVLIKLGNNSVYVFESGLKTPVDVFPDGTVYLKRPIDNGGPDVISLPVTATHRFLNNTYSTMVHVFIDDVNDHCPQCSQRKEFAIEENLSVGSTIGFLEAYDDDMGLNGVIGYRLLDNQNLIRIGTASGKITTATGFDAETLTKIDFNYEVFDHGSPSRAVVCNATVVITDVNDNAPVFDRDVYTAAINVNNLSENRTIAIVMARDKDRFEVMSKMKALMHRKFETEQEGQIDGKSGKISRKGRLRPDSRFNISVAAIDENGQLATAVLIVTTSSDDSAPPVFDRMEPFNITDEKFDVDSWGNVILTADTITSGTHDFVVTASTAFQNATAVQKVIVESDSAAVGGRTFRVKENSAPETITEIGEDQDILLTVPSTSAFEISDQKLVLSMPLDYEDSSSYYILVGNKKTSQLITIEVTDVNDNDPECDATTFIVYTLPFSTVLRCDTTESAAKLTYRTNSSKVKISDDGRVSVSSLKKMVTSVAVDVMDGEKCVLLALHL
ncbi:cadherin domain protein [Teladorsagia circumcincta]|uniref:Cadherin domain protein n=1 Tax=Teladorsagia circumcincta TaxID=45464 RepID=A0A2G9UHH1_TELCI|nr:cadherin domain protein [Teladorsagia circumcincta]